MDLRQRPITRRKGALGKLRALRPIAAPLITCSGDVLTSAPAEIADRERARLRDEHQRRG